MRRPRYFQWFALLLPVVVIVAIWFRSDDWATDLTVPPNYPVWATDARPQLVKTNALPALTGYTGAKPVVCADHRGNVLVISHGITETLGSDIRPSRSLGSGSDILLWRSTDRGTSWARPRNLTNQAKDGAFFFDMWLETDHRGRFYCVYSLVDDFIPRLARSRDAGENWQLSIEVGPAYCDRPVLGVTNHRQSRWLEEGP